jgi:hypothetical protein
MSSESYASYSHFLRSTAINELVVLEQPIYWYLLRRADGISNRHVVLLNAFDVTIMNNDDYAKIAGSTTRGSWSCAAIVELLIDGKPTLIKVGHGDIKKPIKISAQINPTLDEKSYSITLTGFRSHKESIQFTKFFEDVGKYLFVKWLSENNAENKGKLSDPTQKG